MKKTVVSTIGIRTKVTGTLVLALLALAGNILNMPLFFGVSFIFGSIAVMLAVALFGTIPAVLVAITGGLYTVILWGHPYSLIIFSIEALVVGLLYQRGMRNLVLADLIYWLVLGAPLALQFHHGILGMDLSTAILIAIKQPLNGLFNALLAGLLILGMQLTLHGKQRMGLQPPRLASLQFHVMLTAILLAGATPIIHKAYNERTHYENFMGERLHEQAHNVIELIETNTGAYGIRWQAQLDKVQAPTETGLALIHNDGRVLASRGIVSSVSSHGGEIHQLAGALCIWLPTRDMPTMQRWKQGRYQISLPVNVSEDKVRVVVEYAAEPLILKLQEEQLSLFFFLVGILLLGIIVSRYLSQLLTQPLSELEKISSKLTTQIAEGLQPTLPDSPVQEYSSLANTLREMSTSLSSNFHQLHRTQAGLEQQIQGRTAELLESQQRFAFAVEGAGDGIWDWDIPCNTVQYSRLYMEMLGYSENELPQNAATLTSLLHPDDSIGAQQKLRAFLEHRIALYTDELRLRCKDGSYKWILCRGTIVERDETGKALRMIGIHSDISERKQASVEIERLSARLKLATESTGIGVLEWDVVNNLMAWDSTMCNLYGLDTEPVGVSYEAWQKLIHPEDIEHANIRTKLSLRDELPLHMEYRVIWPDGEVHWLEARATVQRDKNGTPTHITGVNWDITERHHAEQSLVAALEEAERANHAKSEFLSSMSHELRTPMNAILGFGQLLEYDNKLADEHRDYVHEILKAGNHLLQLINEVLDLTRVESGHLDLSLEPVSVSPIVEECLNLIASLADRRNIHISQGGLKQASVRADRTRFKQVLLNLLSNAIKYNREGGSVKVEVLPQGTDRLRIRVSDTGPGIPAARLPELFQPFNRLNAQNSNIEGTGIGLTITRRILEMMGGSVDVESEVGVGSSFWIELPLESLMPESTQTDATAAQASNNTPALAHSDTSQQCLLYIEDNPSNLRLVTQILGRRPHIRLLTAHTPELGIELAQTRHPDLILLDINLPGMNGYQVLKVFKQDEYLKNTPIVAITANAMPKDIERGMAEGFTDYLTKPLDVQRFHAVIDKLLESAGSQ